DVRVGLEDGSEVRPVEGPGLQGEGRTPPPGAARGRGALERRPRSEESALDDGEDRAEPGVAVPRRGFGGQGRAAMLLVGDVDGETPRAAETPFESRAGAGGEVQIQVVFPRDRG